METIQKSGRVCSLWLSCARGGILCSLQSSGGDLVGRAVPARGVLDDGGRTPAPKHWRRAAVGTREDRFSS